MLSICRAPLSPHTPYSPASPYTPMYLASPGGMGATYSFFGNGECSSTELLPATVFAERMDTRSIQVGLFSHLHMTFFSNRIDSRISDYIIVSH